MMIRKVTDRDLTAVRHMLEQEEAAGVMDNFLCNWNVVESYQRQRLLIACFDDQERVAGFLAGGLYRIGILQVRHDLRRRGVGRALVKEAARLAKRSKPVLYIECDPSSAEFWRRTGFTVMPFPSVHHRGAAGTELYGYQTLAKRNVVKAVGTPVVVEARLYPESRQYHPATEPLSVKTTTGIEDDAGLIHLKDRLTFFAPSNSCHPGVGDCVIEILVSSVARCCDKAKHSEEIGVQRCRWGYFLDHLRPP